MTLEIVRATLEHAAEIGYIHAMAWQAAYAGLIPASFLAGVTPAKRAARFCQHYATRKEHCYLFQVNGTCAGLAFLGRARNAELPATVGEIGAFYFLPVFWGSPHTHDAMRFCLNHLQAAGYHEVVLWVLEANWRARKFYEKTGFYSDGSQKFIEIGCLLPEIRYRLKFEQKVNDN